MFRSFTVLAAVVALAVSAAPAWAGTSNTKPVLYNGHAGLITNGTADDEMKYVCDVPGFMDYTDDSCMAKARSGWVKAPSMFHGSGQDGEKLFVRGEAKVPPRGASLSSGIPDGTSNTMM